MSMLLVAGLSAVTLVSAYLFYGRFLARGVFGLDRDAVTPGHAKRDGVDFVATPAPVVFGHHFTSIAGTGPIVGPAIAVFWGWLPALLWVLFGSIFVGAVHDFGALVISSRHGGETIGETAGRLISGRARVLFLGALFLALVIVLAIFGLVIASIFALYPATVIPVWASLPLAVWVGSRIRAGASPLGPSLIALAVLYAAVWVGIAVPVDLSTLLGWPLKGPLPNVITAWTGVLLVYCAVASVLPVGWLLQPRDFLNSLQLGVAVVLLLAGLFVAGVTGVATMDAAPAVVPSAELPDGAPPIFPFLFVTIACGACSGFHCLVASGTTSKQLDVETDAKPIGYGGMLSEAGLAVIVILACTAGLGIGVFEKIEANGSQSAATFEPVRDDAGVPLTGSAAWRTKYDATGAWDKFGLGQKVGAFVEGGANFLGAIGLPTAAGITLIATLVACFAATTLDSATRLQRYVVQGLAADLRIAPLKNKYVATAVAVVTGGGLALVPANPTLGPGSGGLLLWPLFGATNQVLAGLAFLVIAFYVRRLGKPVWFLVPAGVLMLVVPATAMAWNITRTWGPSAIADGSASLWTLIGLGVAIVALQVWLCVEAWLAWGDMDDPEGTAAERQADVSSQAALPTTPC